VRLQKLQLKNLQVPGVATEIILSPRFRNMKNSKYKMPQCKKGAAGAAQRMRLRYIFMFFDPHNRLRIGERINSRTVPETQFFRLW
jgi:hypothetical protein